MTYKLVTARRRTESTGRHWWETIDRAEVPEAEDLCLTNYLWGLQASLIERFDRAKIVDGPMGLQTILLIAGGETVGYMQVDNASATLADFAKKVLM